jgi:hypothetical protein
MCLCAQSQIPQIHYNHDYSSVYARALARRGNALGDVLGSMICVPSLLSGHDHHRSDATARIFTY